LYDALDFSTDRDDGGGQTRESLSRIASTSAANAGLDPARFAHQVRLSRQVPRLLARANTASERKITSAACISVRALHGESSTGLAVITGRRLGRTSLRPRLQLGKRKGVMRGKVPTIAWFKDPAGNILSVLEATM